VSLFLDPQHFLCVPMIEDWRAAEKVDYFDAISSGVSKVPHTPLPTPHSYHFSGIIAIFHPLRNNSVTICQKLCLEFFVEES
jgi:hypothetical protein